MLFRQLKPKSLPRIAEKSGWGYDRLARWLQGRQPQKDKAPTLKELRELKKAVNWARWPLNNIDKRIDEEIERLLNEK